MSEQTASQAAYLDHGPARGGHARVMPYTATEKHSRGYLVQRGEVTDRDEVTKRAKIQRFVNHHPLIQRPPETARIVIETWNEKEETWVRQVCMQGGSTLCSGCGEPFGKSQRLGENLFKNLEAARYHVLGHDEDGDLVEEDAFFCFSEAECAAAYKKKCQRKEIVDSPVDKEQIDAETAYRAAQDVLGDEAPLPEGMRKCALASCGRLFIPFTYQTVCCTAAHVAVYKRELDPETKAKQSGERKRLASKYENRYQADLATQTDDEEGT